MRTPLSFPNTFLACLLVSTCALAAGPLVLEGEVPSEGSFFDVPFEVPPGTVELEVRHDDLASENILDWGLEDPNGFRGYGGGNEEPAIVGEQAASRSYLAGPLPAGTWRVTVGKAKIGRTPARYRIEVHLRTQATLAPQPERQPYHPARALSAQARWYTGDFHVHSRESGDARPPLEEVATYARDHGLDFVVLTDHNTTSTRDFLVAAQSRFPGLLLVPGVEYTTYAGHANAIGATGYVSPRVNEGITLKEAVDAFHRQGALFSINHPVYDVGDLCIGCAWQHAVPPGGVDAVEVANPEWEKLGRFFSEGAIGYWDWLLAQGHHAAALGGSDDHRAGVDLDFKQSAIGNPATLVYARELSVAALLEGIREGRTVVKLQGPDDPMVELTSSVAPTGDTVLAGSARLSARVTGARGHQVRFIHNGVRLPLVEVTSEDFVVERDVTAPEHGEDRFRVEVWVNGHPRTVTSHLWIARGADMRGIPGPVPQVTEPRACGCDSAPGWSAGLLALAVLARGRERKRGQKRARMPSDGSVTGGSPKGLRTS
ncbi:PHP domain-containing protein [Archangium violaceum]|uniref:CehA/McbA family metallohydrolase n=1 Tax=Archangium violaceum TaxID=83451 RepID=UPI00193C542E|nr:CehA/McbA family metallohydrolase [Archangium violaceum]QRK12019.1 PHP domain-containing protein [Archangium violaceum]